MAMKISQVVRQTGAVPHMEQGGAIANAATQVMTRSQQPSIEELRRYAEELRRVTAALNRKLELSYHEELNRFVVKVIDPATDKVIRELPPNELQRVHLRIREAIGLLFDTSV